MLFAFRDNTQLLAVCWQKEIENQKKYWAAFPFGLAFVYIQFRQLIWTRQVLGCGVKLDSFTSRILAQIVEAMDLAACKFSPAIIVRFVIMGFELKVSSESAVLYCSTRSRCCWCCGTGWGWYPPPWLRSVSSLSLSYLDWTWFGPEPISLRENGRLFGLSAANRGFFGPGSLDLLKGLRELSISNNVKKEP